VYTCTPNNFCKKKSKFVGKIHGQIRIQVAHIRCGLGVRFRTAGKEGKGKGGHTSSAGEGRRHSRVVAAWKEGGRERETERERQRGEKRKGDLRAALRRASGGPRQAHERSGRHVCFVFSPLLLVIFLKIS
jgi:hypothetical protein